MQLSQNLVQGHGDPITDRDLKEIGDWKSVFTSVPLADKLACIRRICCKKVLVGVAEGHSENTI